MNDKDKKCKGCDSEEACFSPECSICKPLHSCYTEKKGCSECWRMPAAGCDICPYCKTPVTEKKGWEEKTSWNKGLNASTDGRVRKQGLLQRKTNAGYQALHKRLVTDRGRPSKCEHCGTTTAKRFEWANLTGNYADPNDYIRLCRKCHHKMDGLSRNFSSVKGFKERICKKCGKEFKPSASRVFYCGSRPKKFGCAYEEYLAYGRAYHKNKKLSDLLNEQ